MIKETYILKSGKHIIGYAKNIDSNPKLCNIEDLFIQEYNKSKVKPRLLMITGDINGYK